LIFHIQLIFLVVLLQLRPFQTFIKYVVSALRLYMLLVEIHNHALNYDIFTLTI